MCFSYMDVCLKHLTGTGMTPSLKTEGKDSLHSWNQSWVHRRQVQREPVLQLNFINSHLHLFNQMMWWTLQKKECMEIKITQLFFTFTSQSWLWNYAEFLQVVNEEESQPEHTFWPHLTKKTKTLTNHLKACD